MSIGVQSFFEDEAHAIGRPQRAAEVYAALDRLRGFRVLNIDLIYGQPGQTVRTWLASLATALQYGPEELYLYPLYVRPGTGLAKRHGDCRSPAERIRLLYREGRDALLAAGYEQVSMRYFRRPRPAPSAPVYCCQLDGMLGLGCGARSYTSGLHYSSRFAVEPREIHALIEEWMDQSSEELAHAAWGCRLSGSDQRRRFVIQSLLTSAGLSSADYEARFGDHVEEAFPELKLLLEHGLVEASAGSYRLTTLGMELSDAIGPALYAPAHRSRLEKFAHS